MINKLAGKRIVLRKARMDDLSSIFDNVWSDREVLNETFFYVSEDIEEAKDRLRRTIDFQSDKDLFFVTIDDVAIGLAGVIKEEDDVYSEGGIVLGRKYQGLGIGKEIMELLLEYVFKELGGKQFNYYCFKSNIKSIALAKHFGFKLVNEETVTRDHDQKVFVKQKYILINKKDA